MNKLKYTYLIFVLSKSMKPKCHKLSNIDIHFIVSVFSKFCLFSIETIFYIAFTLIII